MIMIMKIVIIIIIIIIIMRAAAAARPRAHAGGHRARELPQMLMNGYHAPAGMSAAEAAPLQDAPQEARRDHSPGPYRVGMPVFFSDVSVQLHKAFKEL